MKPPFASSLAQPFAAQHPARSASRLRRALHRLIGIMLAMFCGLPFAALALGAHAFLIYCGALAALCVAEIALAAFQRSAARRAVRRAEARAEYDFLIEGKAVRK